MIHQDSKVIPQKCASDTEGPSTRDDKNLTEPSKSCRNDYVEWGREERVSRLFFQGDCITERYMSNRNRTVVAVRGFVSTHRESRTIPSEKMVIARK